MNKVKLIIGDWSGDGHERSDEVILSTNKTVEEIQQAYKDSCKLTGLSFNINQDYTELNLNYSHPEYTDRKIATDYQNNTISKLAEEILLKHGINVRDGYICKPDDLVRIDDVNHFTKIWIKFVQLSLPDLILTPIEDDVPVINGWWNKNLNVQFGYGLYY